MGLMVFGIIVRRGLTEPPGWTKSSCTSSLQDSRDDRHEGAAAENAQYAPGASNRFPADHTRVAPFNEANGNFCIRKIV